MKNKTTLAASAVALAVLANLSAANANDLKKVQQQSSVSQTGSELTFATWRNAMQRLRYADVTDRIVVTFKEQSVADAVVASADDSGLGGRFSTNRFSNGGGNQTLATLSLRAGQNLKVVKSLGDGKVSLALPTSMDSKATAELVSRLMADSTVATAEPDHRRYPMAQSEPWGISAVQADLVSDNEASNMTVCIIDSGYDINNPDLSGNQHSGTNDSGTGSWATAGGSHGTHVAGTIAAINNSVGVVGVMPNQNVNLHIIKVFNASGWAYSSDLVSAIGKCQDAGANVVNMSLGGAGSSNSERNAMQSFYDNGMLLVAAAGNDGDSSLSYPASYDSVISVAAVDENGQHAEFSQFTSQVELSGPGEAVLSTVAGDGRQGYITYGSTSVGDDRVLPQSRYVQSGSSFSINNVNGTVSGDLASCSRTGSNYSCGNMTNKICVAERHDNQVGSTYPEIDPAKACADAGAAGVIVYSNTDRPGLQNPFLVDANADITVPTVSVNRTLGQQLVSAAGTSATLQVAGNTDYAYYNGTSMATPHVAGVAALAWSKNPTCTAAEVRSALQATATDLDVSGRDNRTGYGMVQTKAASDYMAANCSSGGGSGGGSGPTALENGASLTGLSAAKDAELEYTVAIPAGATNLSFNMSGGTGDADLYVKFGSAPTTSSYDCRPYNTGNSENCDFATPSEGTYYVKIIGYAAFSGVNFTVNYTEPSTGGGGGATGQTAQVTDISATRNNWSYYTWDVPAGMSTLTFQITGGTGDADMHIRLGSQPTTSAYDCRPYESGNEETCTFNNPAAGTWHIGIRAYRTYSGVTLNAEYQP